MYDVVKQHLFNSSNGKATEDDLRFAVNQAFQNVLNSLYIQKSPVKP